MSWSSFRPGGLETNQSCMYSTVQVERAMCERLRYLSTTCPDQPQRGTSVQSQYPSGHPVKVMYEGGQVTIGLVTVRCREP
jgi:hypothetical protein